MPKAAIDEHRYLPPGEGDIGVDYLAVGQPNSIVFPKPESIPMQQGTEQDFRFRIRPSIGAHLLRRDRTCRRWVMGSLSLSPPGKFLLYGVTFRFQVFGTSFGFRFFLRRLPLFHLFGKDWDSIKGCQKKP